jgi:hypothetical protein
MWAASLRVPRGVYVTATAAVLVAMLIVKPAQDAVEIVRSGLHVPDVTAVAAYTPARLLAPASAVNPDGTVHLSDSFVRVHGYTVTLAHLQDAQAIARANGLTLATALDRYLWQEQFVAMVNTFEQAYPDDYSGAAIIDEGTAGWVGFKRQIPAGVAELVADLPVRVELVANRGFTQEQLGVAAIEIHRRLSTHPDVVAASTTPRHQMGVVTAHVQLRESLSGQQREEVRAALVTMAATPTTPVEVSVLEGVMGRFESTDLRGGARLDHLTTPGRHCMTAFSIAHLDGRRGVATAGHCAAFSGDAQRDYKFPTIRLNKRAHHFGTWGDIAWYGNHSASPVFFSSGGSTRVVTSVARPVEGQDVCNYGRATGHKCTKVADPSTCQSFPIVGVVCRQVRTVQHVTDDTDSGGPWFSGNTALGIHTGECLSGGGSCFTDAFAYNASPMGTFILKN